MKSVIKKIINFFFKLFKVKENKILFECGRGMVDGSPRAIYNYLKKNYNDKYRLMWLVSKDADVSFLDKKDYSYYHTFKGLYHQATSKYWIKSESIGSILTKRKNQIYIQAWHGHGALKKMSYDVFGHKDEPLEHTKEWDYLLLNDELDKFMMLSSTGYKGKYFTIGTPLTDYVYEKAEDSEFKDNLKKKLGINNNKPIVFYAPTFRDEDLGKELVDLKIDKLTSLNEANIMLRVHPLIRNQLTKEFWDKHPNFINCNLYPDSSDLLTITDILISDYSSIIYEYSILEKPMIFYAYDVKEYEKTRGFYIDYYKDLPGNIVYTEEELINEIRDLINNPSKDIDKIRNFNKKYNYLCDKNVCKRFVNLLNENEFK